MAEIPGTAAPSSSDPRYALKPADLVAALAAGSIAIDFGTYPDADTAIYARISLDRKDRTSVERQLEIGIAWAQERGLSYVVYTDRKSAYRREIVRRNYQAMLDAIRARHIKQVGSYKIDRLYRQVEELMEVIKIADGGRVPVTLIGIDDEDAFDLTTAKGCDEAIGRVLEAQRESRRTSERVRNQRQKAREQGIPSPGMRAFGWRDRIHQHEEEAKALEQAYRAILHGSSVRAIATKWDEEGYTGGRGGRWRVTTVKRVLTNQRNAGRLTHTYETFDEHGNPRTVTEIVKPDAFDPIVDPETFEAVQRELKRRERPSRHPRRRSMLTGIVHCARCGRTMSRTPVQGRPVYRCWSSNIGADRGCGLTISAEHLEPFVEDALFRYVDSPEFARKLADRSEIGTRRAELIAKKDRLTMKRDALRKRMLTADYDDELYGYEQDVRELAGQLKDVNAELALFQPVHAAAQWAGNGTGLREAWETRFDADEKRTIIADAFERVTVKPSRRMGRGYDSDRIDLGAERPRNENGEGR